MKKLAFKSAFLLFFVLMVFSGCKKSSSPAEAVSFEGDIIIISDQAIASLDAQEVYSDKPDLGIYMLDEGIAPCFLADAPDLTGDDTLRPRIRHNALIACLRSLSLTESQIPLVKADLHIFYKTNEQAISRAKAIYKELQAQYKDKYNRLIQAYRAGTITAAEFRAKVAELRVQFKRELRSLHLREKLDDVFKRSFRTLLSSLHAVLTDRQWNAFKECYRGSI
ncbi:MAG: hypothetical protein NTY96_11015 [Bacteroidetes bacterium]|nr:hypothetical protein [Bacteroidota bacterium]